MLNKERITVELDEYLSQKIGPLDFSGTVLITQKDEIMFSKSYGMADIEHDVPNKLETVFKIASVSKQFTAVAILQLCEKKLIKLGDTLDKYIEDYPNGNKITIHDLLVHSSGIADYEKAEGFSKLMKIHYTVEELIEVFKGFPFDFEPGEMFKYSNSGYILLGYILEKVTGKTYEEYLTENIFKPLNMENTGYDNHLKIIKNKAKGYSIDMQTGELSNADFIDASFAYAAGALYSTVSDLKIWNENLVNGKLLSDEYLQKMFTKHIKGNGSNYGYGVFVDELKTGDKCIKRIEHAGGIPGFILQNRVYPEYDVQIIMLSNTESPRVGLDIMKAEHITFLD